MNEINSIVKERQRPTHLYRCFGADGELLYVGISHSALKRIGEHRFGGNWSATVTNMTIEPFHTRQEALAAETIAIRDEKPLFNIVRPPRMTARLPGVKHRPMFNFRLPEEEYQLLVRFAAATDRSKTDVMRELVRSLANATPPEKKPTKKRKTP